VVSVSGALIAAVIVSACAPPEPPAVTPPSVETAVPSSAVGSHPAALTGSLGAEVVPTAWALDPTGTPSVATPFEIQPMSHETRTITGADGLERTEGVTAYMVGRSDRQGGIYGIVMVIEVTGPGDPVSDMVASAKADGRETWTESLSSVEVQFATRPDSFGTGATKVSAGWRAGDRWLMLDQVSPDTIDALIEALFEG
jgi:hypothetical protein